MADSTQSEDIAQSWIRDYPEILYDAASGTITCTKCEVSLKAKKSNFTRHLNSKTHRGVKVESPADFYYDLTYFLIMCNIPWIQVENPVFRTFFEKYICRCHDKNRTLPSESTLRKKLDKVFESQLQPIKNEVKDQKLWISLDETTDFLGRYVIHFLVKPLNGQFSGPIYMLACKTLQKVNGRSVYEFVIDCLRDLWADQFHDKLHNVLMLSSDSVAYMLLAGKMLKKTLPNMKHFTCMAHALHRLTETIRSNYTDVDILINNVKKVFLKAPNRVNVLKEMFPDLPLPPQPVITRWGTWLKAAFYYAEHLEKISSVVNTLNSNEAESIRQAKNVFKKQNLKVDLQYIYDNFEIIQIAITRLEKRDLSIIEAFEIFDEVRLAIEWTMNNKFIHKLNQLINRNPDFDVLREICEKINQESDIYIYKYAPLTSVDVERSFSMFKWILTESRNRLTMANLEKIIIIYYNSKQTSHVSNALNVTDSLNLEPTPGPSN